MTSRGAAETRRWANRGILALDRLARPKPIR